MKQSSPLNPAYSLHTAQDFSFRLVMVFWLAALLQLIPFPAYAGDADALTVTLCTIVGWFTGQMGSAIATMGILVLGIGAMLGKVSWQMALIVAVGISIMFSGAQIVSGLTGQNGNICEGAAGGFEAETLTDALCTVAALAQGASGRAIGTIGLVILGISALMGKLSAPMALVLASGIALFFGADMIAETLAESGNGLAWQGCTPAG